MKQPKPDKLVVTFGIPMTVHSAGVYPNGSSIVSVPSRYKVKDGLTVRWEDTQMTTSDKLFVIQTQDRVVGVQELGVEDDLDSISRSVEQLDSSDLVQDWVGGIVGHVMSDNRRERVSLERKHSSFEENLVFRREEIFRLGHFSSVLPDKSALGI